MSSSLFVYLDESGDLGVDFENKKPSKHFIITILVCGGKESADFVKKIVEKTIKNKLRVNNKYLKMSELKGAGTNIKTKSYFFNQLNKNNAWEVYSIVIDKKRIMKELYKPTDKHRIYNVMACCLLRQVDFSKYRAVNLFVDRSKNRNGIKEFDMLLRLNLEAMLPLKTPLNITHVCSHENYGIQAVDLLCWGIFRKYESEDDEWYNTFMHKIIYEKMFLI